MLVVAEALVAEALGEGWSVVDRFSGGEHGALDLPAAVRAGRLARGRSGHFVVLADYVTTEDGTGLVHQAPAFGADDLAVGRATACRWSTRCAPTGTSWTTCALVGGVFFKTADKALVQDLDARGLLFRQLAYEHSYPHCWRCHTALLYYAQPSWYIRTTQVKDALLAENEKTNWFPDNIKWGRYGDWLHNNIDWALSRGRAIGAPRCRSGSTTRTRPSSWRRVAGRARRAGRAGTLGARPAPALRRRHRRSPARRARHVPPGARGHRRLVRLGLDAVRPVGISARRGQPRAVRAAYPAQFICEAIDQTRGWFYTLMAVNTIVHGRSSYENVLCLGLILAEDGRKMSKHLGQHPRADPADGRPRCRRAALVHGRQRLALAAAAGGPRRPAGDRAQDAADLLEHRLLPHALRRRERLGAATRRRPTSPTVRCSTGGRSPSCTGW